jgi:hypothetical protein
MVSSAADAPRQENGPDHYDLPAAALPSFPKVILVLEGHIARFINHILTAPWRSHFVDGSKGW